MRKLLIAAVFVLFPLASFAEDVPSTDVHSGGFSRLLWVSAGVVGGVILMDMLIGGSMTAPVVSLMNPAVREARAAGAVFGEQIAAATEIRDNQARAAMAYTFLIGAGAVLGGWVISRFVAPPQQQAIMK